MKIIKKLKRKTAFILAFTVMFTAMPGISGIMQVKARDLIATVTNSTSVAYYYKFSDLTDAIEKKFKGQTITVDMKASWNAAGSEDYNRRIFVPAKTRVTLNMHGLVFNRNNAYKGKDKYNGELILVDKGATLIVNGGTEEERNSHSYPEVALYNTNDPSGDKASARGTFKGGLLTGGCSCDGAGGIHARGGSTVILNDVTIAGCGQTRYGKGGGIWMWDDDSRLVMNNSRVTGCYASSYGGGICIYDDDAISIEMNNSVVDNNYAGNRGGGIYTDGEKCHVMGRNNSEIHSNYCSDYGGGVCINDQDTSVSGLYIHDNKANYGGGVYTNDDNISLSNLKIKNNKADTDGGGIYINNKKDTISGCEIAGNRANRDGGGVYIPKGITEQNTVSGKTLVRSNSAKGQGNDFHVAGNSPGAARVNFKLTKGSEVRVSFSSAMFSDVNSVPVTEGKKDDTIKTPNCIQYLHPANPGFHFTYNPAPNMRKIFYVRDGHDSSDTGKAYEKPTDPEKVLAIRANNASSVQDGGGTQAGIVGTVGPGGSEGSEYDLIRGFSHHQSTAGDMEDIDNAFYYSDAFFAAVPETYNDHLATASLSMAFSGMYLRALEPEDANGNRYYNKHAGIRQFLADIGCPDNSITINESMEKVPGIDTIGVTIASKELVKSDGTKTGKILVPVVVRGGGYEREWGSNATLGKASVSDRDKEAQGFSEAADQVFAEVEKYITKYQLNDAINEGNVKFWVTGYSRAGATANITSKRLIEKYACDDNTAGKNNQVFAYTCEAPMGGTDEAEKLDDKTKYYCIHNLVNAVDIVPLVAPELMGFKRYGVDHYIPGNNYSSEIKVTEKDVTRGGVSGASHITTYCDNEADYVKNGVGENNVYNGKMLQQLKAIDDSIILDDYFHPMTMNFVPGIEIVENGDYDNNNVEAFVKDFIRYAMEGYYPSRSEHWSQAVKHRDNFADNIQPGLRHVLSLIFSLSDEESNSFVDRASTFMDRIGKLSGTVSKLDIYIEVIGGQLPPAYGGPHEYISGWSHTSAERKKAIIDFFWQTLNETGAFDALDKSDVSTLHEDWPKLADFVFTLMEGDHTYRPYSHDGENFDLNGNGWARGGNECMMLLGTFAAYSSYILMNHYPEVNLAWARAYDSYYDSENTEYGITSIGYRVDKPTASAKDPLGDDMTLAEGIDKVNSLYGDQKIILDVDRIVGEAIYYDLTDDTDGTVLATNLCYRGGVDLSPGVDSDTGAVLEKSYTITCYAISYGIRSQKAVYKLRFNEKRSLTVTDGTTSEEYSYYPGSTVTLSPQLPENTYFKYWTIGLLDAGGNVVCECEQDLLSPDANTQNVTFTMPIEGTDLGEYKVPNGYSLVATWHVQDKIRRIEVIPDNYPNPDSFVPVLGQELPGLARFIFTAGEETHASQKAQLVSWSWYADGETKADARLVPNSKDGEIFDISSKAGYDTYYIATIHIPENTDAYGAFVPTEQLLASVSGGEGKVDSITATRDDDDGSVTIVIEFSKTESGTPPAPEKELSVKVNLTDVNSSQPADEPRTFISESGAMITMVAPDVLNEQFISWDLKDKLVLDPSSNITDRVIIATVLEAPAGSEIEVEALYSPVINRVDLNLDTPVSDEEMQMIATDSAGNETMAVTIENQYVIHPDFVDIEWTPEPLDGEGDKKIADQNTEYTAKVSLAPKKDDDGKDYIMARLSDGSEYAKMAGIFAFSPDVTVKLNNETALLDRDNKSVSFTFPATERTRFNLVSVTTPDNVENLPHGTTQAEVEKYLPATVKLLVDTGMELDGNVTWELSSDATEETRNAVIWTASGTVELPTNVENPDGVSLYPEFFIQVNEADHATAPYSTLPSDVYIADQSAYLETTQEGGKTYYTTDGSEPTAASTEYKGEEIPICRHDPNLVDETFIGEDGNEYETGRKMFILKAFTVKDEMWDSPVMTYTYIFDNAIPVPSGETYVFDGTEQILIQTDEFFTVVESELPDGCHLNKNGDPVAKNVGSYELTLHINDGYVWSVETTDEDGKIEKSGTTDDQKVTFEITNGSLKDAKVRVLTDPIRLDEDTGCAEPEVEVTLNDTVIDPSDYDVFYADNTSPGTGKVWVVGKNNCATEEGGEESISAEFTFGIYEDDAFGFSFDAIPDQTYTGKAIIPSVKVYYEGTPLTEKKDYTIAFNYNTDSSDSAKFTVKGKGNYSGTEDGTFTILPKDIAAADVEISQIAPSTYNSKRPKPYKPVPKITYNRMTLKKDRDFTVKYFTDEACTQPIEDPEDIGKYYVRLDGVDDSNYTGCAFLEFSIIDPSLKPVSKLSVKKIQNRIFTGQPVVLKDLDLVVKDGTKELVMGDDYEATCFGLNPGTGWVLITGNENKGYTGRRFIEFTITGFPLSKASISGFETAFDHNGQEIKQKHLHIEYKKDRDSDPEQLHEGIDYTVTYSDNINAGRATMTITGNEDRGYTGTVKKTFTIRPWSIKANNIDISLNGSAPYAKGGAMPEPVVTAAFDGLDEPVTLELNKDYKLFYSNNKDIHNGTGKKAPTVTVKGIGNYKDMDNSTTFAITETSMEEAGVKVIANDLEESTVKGKWKSAITVVDRNGNKLTAGKDYDKNNIIYSYDEDGNEPVGADDIVPAGTPIYVSVSATGSPYSGSAKGCYRILKKGYDISRLNAKVVPKDPKKFTSREVKITEDEIVWTKGGKPVDVEFVIEEYKNNINSGKAKVTVQGKGDWGGRKEITYSIDPRGFLWWWRL